jgi:hypothetical protein
MVATVLAGISAASGLIGTASNLFSNKNTDANTNTNLQYQALRNAENSQYQSQLIQALIDQRSVAGQTDSFGTSIQYDPTTNQWTTTYGALPKAAETAQMQAGISRNTYDLRQAQLANQEAALRATRAASAADAAARNVGTFRPMTSDELTGLLQQQASSAQEKTWNPLIADTLRSMARSGTSAEPVLGKLGTDEAQSLRDSLVDAQIKGMENVDTINQSRLKTLTDAATSTANLATPSFTYPNISSSGVDNTMAQTVASRAQSAATAPAQGEYSTNLATSNVSNAAKTTGTQVQAADNTNYASNQLTAASKSLSSLTGQGGSVANFITDLFSGSGSGSNKNTSGTGTDDSWDTSAA